MRMRIREGVAAAVLKFNMAAQRQLRALANDRNLRRFVVQARPTGRQLGTGSYGTVEEVEVNGLVCAGKKIHEILLDVGNVGVQEIATKYVQECQLMSDLRHPNITQFLGLCFLPNCQLPVLVMERLDSSLDDLLETVPNIHLTMKRSILEDIARGLLYLHKHSPQIIHRDLTSKNVLLTSALVAKITDLGNSRIVNIQPGQLAQTLSRNPGTLVYMPPEALADVAHYGPSLDIFSFGHLGIFVGLQTFPGNLLEPTYMDPEDRHNLKARSEVERRMRYIQQLENTFLAGDQHPLVLLVKKCLHNDPSERPTSEEVVTALEEMKADIEGPYGEIAKADAVRQVVMMRALKRRETEVREKSDESAAKDEEIHQLQQELDHKQAELARSNEQLQQKDAQIQHKDADIQQKNAEIRQKDAQIHRQAAELLQNNEQLQQKDEQTRQLTAELQQKDTELNNIQENFQRLLADMEKRDAQLRDQEEELKQKDIEISRLMGELGQCQDQLRRLEQEQVRSVQEELSQSTEGQNKTSLKLKWRAGESMPSNMADCQAVLIGDNVYIGGGDGYTSLESQTVMVYKINSGSWTMVPSIGKKWFGMAAVNGELVLVGGKRLSPKGVTSELAVWDEGLRSWTHPLPDMPTARHSAAVVAYQGWLIVAGGDNGYNVCLNKVEVLDTHSKNWFESSSLPMGCSTMSSVVSGNMWYLSGGTSTLHINQHIFNVCLDELISQAVWQPGTHPAVAISRAMSPWQILTDTPVKNSTLLTLCGALLTVGGDSSSAIHIYQPSSRNWVKIGDLPTKRSQCTIALLPNGEVFVAGGQDELRGRPHTLNRCDIATVVYEEIL